MDARSLVAAADRTSTRGLRAVVILEAILDSAAQEVQESPWTMKKA